MINLTTDTFNETIQSTPVAIVDFWAEWCAPCKAMLPTLEAIDEEVVPVFKVNVDQEIDLAREFKIQSIPTVILFSDGVEVERSTGAKTKDKLTEDLRVDEFKSTGQVP